MDTYNSKKRDRKENIVLKYSRTYDQFSPSEHYYSQSMKECHVWQRRKETAVQCENIQ